MQGPSNNWSFKFILFPSSDTRHVWNEQSFGLISMDGNEARHLRWPPWPGTLMFQRVFFESNCSVKDVMCTAYIIRNHHSVKLPFLGRWPSFQPSWLVDFFERPDEVLIGFKHKSTLNLPSLKFGFGIWKFGLNDVPTLAQAAEESNN